MAWIKGYTIESKRTGRTERRFRAHYRDAAGRQVAKVFKVRRDAQHWLDERTHERVTGTLPDRRAGRQTLRELWDEVHASTDYAVATRSLHGHVWRYVESLGNRAIGDLTPALLSRVLEQIERPHMREKARLVLSAVLGHAVESGRINTNPARRQRRPATRASRRPRNGESRTYLDVASLRRLVAALPERYHALVRLMAHVGLRPGEAYALTVGQVGTALTVDRSTAGPTKTGETRTIPLPETAVRRPLAEHIARFSDPTAADALVFTTEDGQAVTHGPFRRLLARACERAAVPRVTPNDLRHTAAAFAIEHGGSVYAVQRMLGHAKPSITLDIYGHLWDKDAS